MAATITIARFELVPVDDPRNYAVGFRIRGDNGRETYIEELVPLSQASGKADQAIVEIAYAQKQAIIDQEMARLRSQSSVIGQVFETEAMRREREAEEKATAEAVVQVTAEADLQAQGEVTSSEDAPKSGQEDEVFPGGRRAETAEQGTEERDDNSDANGNGDSHPRRRRRAS